MLLDELVVWIEQDRDRARIALEESASEAIAHLPEIDRRLFG
jgi:hypothetical protein